MLAVTTLNPRLQGVALGLRARECPAHGTEPALHLTRARLAHLEIAAQSLQAIFALDHAGMLIVTAAHAHPVRPDPLTAARDDRLAVSQRRALSQRFRQGLAR